MITSDLSPSVTAAIRDVIVDQWETWFMPEHHPGLSGQKDVLKALETTSTNGEPKLRRVDTHMSHLFLSKNYVMKLIRAVHHPYADMSRLRQRKASCDAELEINKIFAPALYECVLPVVQTATATYEVGGDGMIVDYVVRMRRFPDGCLFSDLANAHRLTKAMIEDAVSALAAFQRIQHPQSNEDASQHYDVILEGLEQTVQQGAPSAEIDDLARNVFKRLRSSYAPLAPLIDARRRAGFVRRGHGDFHLKNICIFEGKVTPFDALAFDAKLATTDILYDVAFLLMDLQAKGLDALAACAMNSYFDVLDQDERALSLLPFFMALRASVRMAVSIEALEFDETESYGRLALRRLDPAFPRLVAIGGLSGAGKSDVARGICHFLPGPCGSRILSTDATRKREAGVKVSDHMPEKAYDGKSRSVVYNALARRESIALQAGTSVIADGTYREGESRMAIAAAAGQHSFLGLWLQTSSARRAERVAARHDDWSDATVAVVATQEEPQELGPSWQKVDANGKAAHTIMIVGAIIEESCPPPESADTDSRYASVSVA